MEHSSLGHKRRSRRAQVLLAATLQHGSSCRSVKLRNLSAEGALVEGSDMPAEGAEVLFQRNELNARGRVVWVKGRYAGIAFSEKLHPEHVLRHVPKPRPKLQPRYWRPGLTVKQLTPEQRRLAESWVWSPTVSALGE